MRKSRYRIVYMTPQLLMQRVLEPYRETNGRMICHKVEGLPDDYEVTGVAYDFTRCAFAIQLWHKDFELVPEHALAPELHLTITAYVDAPQPRGRQFI